MNYLGELKMDIEKLEKLNELKEKGILTQEEFEEQKQNLLGNTVKPNEIKAKNTEPYLNVNYEEDIDDVSYIKLNNTYNKDDFSNYTSQKNENGSVWNIFFNIVITVLIIFTIHYVKTGKSIFEDVKMPIFGKTAQEVDALTGINSLNEKQLSYYCTGVLNANLFDIRLDAEEFIASSLAINISSVIMFGEDEENIQQKAIDDILNIIQMEKAPEYIEYLSDKCGNHLEKVVKEFEKKQKQKEYIFDEYNILNMLRKQ